MPGGNSEARYVVAIRPETREVVVGSADELLGHSVELSELNWLSEPVPVGESCQVQLRYRSRAVNATVTAREDDAIRLNLETPIRAITPGQSGVLYSPEGRVLGGGVIV